MRKRTELCVAYVSASQGGASYVASNTGANALYTDRVNKFSDTDVLKNTSRKCWQEQVEGTVWLCVSPSIKRLSCLLQSFFYLREVDAIEKKSHPQQADYSMEYKITVLRIEAIYCILRVKYIDSARKCHGREICNLSFDECNPSNEWTKWRYLPQKPSEWIVNLHNLC